MQEKGLRERKKAETWEAIHTVAAEAVLKGGLESITVEQIAQRVGISPRTFFNYFPSKDHAVLGLREPVIPDGAMEGLRPGPQLLAEVVNVLDQVVRSARPTTHPSRRHRLLREHPHLMGLHKQSVHRTEDLVRAALLERLTETAVAELVDDDAVPIADRVRMLVLVAGGVLRFAWTSPEGLPGTEPTPEDYQRALATYDFLNETDLS